MSQGSSENHLNTSSNIQNDTTSQVEQQNSVNTQLFKGGKEDFFVKVCFCSILFQDFGDSFRQNDEQNSQISGYKRTSQQRLNSDNLQSSEEDIFKNRAQNENPDQFKNSEKVRIEKCQQCLQKIAKLQSMKEKQMSFLIQEDIKNDSENRKITSKNQKWDEKYQKMRKKCLKKLNIDLEKELKKTFPNSFWQEKDCLLSVRSQVKNKTNKFPQSKERCENIIIGYCKHMQLKFQEMEQKWLQIELNNKNLEFYSIEEGDGSLIKAIEENQNVVNGLHTDKGFLDAKKFLIDFDMNEMLADFQNTCNDFFSILSTYLGKNVILYKLEEGILLIQTFGNHTKDELKDIHISLHNGDQFNLLRKRELQNPLALGGVNAGDEAIQVKEQNPLALGGVNEMDEANVNVPQTQQEKTPELKKILEVFCKKSDRVQKPDEVKNTIELFAQKITKEFVSQWKTIEDCQTKINDYYQQIKRLKPKNCKTLPKAQETEIQRLEAAKDLQISKKIDLQKKTGKIKDVVGRTRQTLDENDTSGLIRIMAPYLRNDVSPDDLRKMFFFLDQIFSTGKNQLNEPINIEELKTLIRQKYVYEALDGEVNNTLKQIQGILNEAELFPKDEIEEDESEAEQSPIKKQKK